jgi:hypothetical protein
MCNNIARLIPICPELEKIAPNTINHGLLLDITDKIIEEAQIILPLKRSGYDYKALFYADLYCTMTGLSHKPGTHNLKEVWKGQKPCFQRYEKVRFINGKRRQNIPDQPDLSRFLQMITENGITGEYTNCILWAQLLYMIRQKEIKEDVILIADYHDDPCPKDKNDPYCFGTKKGKTMHRTLVFSIISGDLHLIFATFKIKKQQKILPLFQQILEKLKKEQVKIKYCLLDRQFYRKDILPALKEAHITTILPGRNCKDSKQKIHLWIQDQSGRTGKICLKLRYVKGIGHVSLRMDMVLVGKRGYTLDEVKHEFHSKKITEKDASKRIFPLLVIKGNSKGITAIRGNENYIRELYRNRWAIEIAFRETHLIGISNWLTNRDKCLYHFSLKCFIYNLWQIAKINLNHENPNADPLTLDEFCGRLMINRSKLVRLEPIKN